MSVYQQYFAQLAHERAQLERDAKLAEKGEWEKLAKSKESEVAVIQAKWEVERRTNALLAAMLRELLDDVEVTLEKVGVA